MNNRLYTKHLFEFCKKYTSFESDYLNLLPDKMKYFSNPELIQVVRHIVKFNKLFIGIINKYSSSTKRGQAQVQKSQTSPLPLQKMSRIKVMNHHLVQQVHCHPLRKRKL